VIGSKRELLVYTLNNGNAKPAAIHVTQRKIGSRCFGQVTAGNTDRPQKRRLIGRWEYSECYSTKLVRQTDIRNNLLRHRSRK
jgi:hypothetical protein